MIKKRIMCLILVFVLVFSLCFNAAAVEGPAMPSYSGEWYNPQKIESLKKNNTQLIVTTKIKSVATNLYVEFPEEGGVRLHTDSEGYFTPKGLNSISYTTESSDSLLLSSGDMKARLKYGNTVWSFEILDNDLSVRYSLLSTQMHFGFDSSSITKVKLCGTVHTNEVIYGLGERFNNLNLVGQKPMDLWNLDTAYHYVTDPTEATLSYINVPFMHSSEGYSLFFNSTFGGTADIGYTNPNEYSLELNGSDFDVYFYSETPLENIESYTNLTGKPATLPKWAYEYWSGGATQYWSNLWPDQTDEAGPLSVLQTEIDNYNRIGVKPSAVFAENTPSKHKSFYDMAATQNMRVLGWTNPQVDFMTLGLLTANKMKSFLPSVSFKDLPHTKVTSSAQFSNDGFIDFTHPNAQVLLEAIFEEPFSYGLKGLMVDYGEYLPSGYSFYNGMQGEEMHNFYSYWYTKGYHDLFQNEMGNDHVLFARAGSAGSQQWGAVFNGDQGNTFTGLRLAYNGGLNLSASGFSSYGTDIGGIADIKDSNPELYMRWLQYATFNPIMRQHGVTSRNCWSYGELAEKTFIELYAIRENILNLIYSANLKAGDSGDPMVQRMAVAFPEQKELVAVTDQYLFANELLVCPVLEEGKTSKTVYFPAGETWIDIWTGETINGGIVREVEAPVNRIPVYIRGGAAIPVTVSDKFAIGSEIGDSSYEALLVTPTQKSRITEFNYDDASVKNKVELNDSILSVSAENSAGHKVVIASGINASSVSVNGTQLAKLNALPLTDTASGYYVDYKNNSTVIFAGDNWSKIDITDSGNVLKNLAAGASFKTNVNDVDAVYGILDEKANTIWNITDENSYAVVDLGQVYDVETILLKWAEEPTSFSLSYSVDNANWNSAVSAASTFGGENSYSVAGQMRYIKINNIKDSAELIALEVFGKEFISKTEQSVEKSSTATFIADLSGNITADGNWGAYWSKDISSNSEIFPVKNAWDNYWDTASNSFGSGIVRAKNTMTHYDKNGKRIYIWSPTYSATANLGQLTYTARSYEDFELEFNYTFSNSSDVSSRVLVGFGRKNPLIYANARDGGYILEFNSSGNVALRSKDGVSAYTTNAPSSSARGNLVRAKLVVKDGKASIYSNDVLLNTYSLSDNYDGFISLGATLAINSGFYKFELTSEAGETIDENQFCADFSQDISSDDSWSSYWVKDSIASSAMKVNPFVCSWQNKDNSIVRTNQDSYWNGAGLTDLTDDEKTTITSTFNVAQLVYTERTYQNFVMNFKYKFSSSAAKNSRILLGFGRNNPAEYATGKDGGFVLEISGNSGLVFRSADGTVNAENTTSLGTDSTVSVTVIVDAWKATVIANNIYLGSFNLPNDYDGYISVGATKSAGSTISGLDIISLEDSPLGDFTGDGEIDIRDLVRLKNYTLDTGVKVYSPLDINIDGEFNAVDLIFLKRILWEIM